MTGRQRLPPASLLLGWLILGMGSSPVMGGMTYILLKGTGSSCISVDPLPGATVLVKYHLPDLIIKEDIDQGILPPEKEITEDMTDAEKKLIERQREIALKRAREGKDVSIAISQRLPYPTVTQADPGEREKPRNLREQPTEREGQIDFETSESGGAIQICIHSLFASRKGPYRVGLDINQRAIDSDDADTRAARALLLSTELAGKVYTHLSAFSKEMIRAENLVRNILSSAEVVKQEEVEFHEQSIRMERGVHFWPMLHLVCLLVAAFLQVRHIVQFMHAKHIC